MIPLSDRIYAILRLRIGHYNRLRRKDAATAKIRNRLDENATGTRRWLDASKPLSLFRISGFEAGYHRRLTR
jgi:hypothetical protein